MKSWRIQFTDENGKSGSFMVDAGDLQDALALGKERFAENGKTVPSDMRAVLVP